MLEKKKSGTEWVQRWFVLTNNKLMRFDRKNGKLLGTLTLDSETTLAANEMNGNTSFEIKSGSGFSSTSLILRADSEENMHYWLNLLIKAKLFSDESITLKFTKGDKNSDQQQLVFAVKQQKEFSQ